MVVTGPMSELTVWCPSCGTEYRAGSQQCSECRVALVAEQPQHLPGDAESEDEEGGLVELGEWPKLQAQLLRRRLETASVPVMIEWSSDIGGPVGTLLVPEEQAEFASAVVNEIDVDEEIADVMLGSPTLRRKPVGVRDLLELPRARPSQRRSAIATTPLKPPTRR